MAVAVMVIWRQHSHAAAEWVSNLEEDRRQNYLQKISSTSSSVRVGELNLGEEDSVAAGEGSTRSFTDREEFA